MKVIWISLFVTLCCWERAFAQQQPRIWERGFSDQYKSENNLGQYAFGYNEDHTSGGSFRREASDQFGNKIGSYGLRIADGRVRIVNYIADKNGFRADVISNEPGMASQKANKYLRVTKKNIYGVLVPGFRYAAEAPHVTFDEVEDDDSTTQNAATGSFSDFNSEPGTEFGSAFGEEMYNTQDDATTRYATGTEVPISQDEEDDYVLDREYDPIDDLRSFPTDAHRMQSASKDSNEAMADLMRTQINDVQDGKTETHSSLMPTESMLTEATQTETSTQHTEESQRKDVVDVQDHLQDRNATTAAKELS